MRHSNNWSTHPAYMKLVEFLVKKTKDVKTVMNVRGLIREFKNENNSTAKDHCLKSRIRRFCSVIHKFPYMDTETKVKLMFGLSAPVDHGLLEELRKEADVLVDDFDQIVHYKKNGGGLELIGKHKARKAEVSHNQILEFLAKKVEKTSGIIELNMLAKQLKAEIRSSQHDRHLQKRIRQATKQIYESELFDEKMKVKMIFATSTVVEDYALKELRKNATVVVDDNNRIIEYQKNDGSLNLKRKAIRRVSFNQKQKKQSEIKSDDEGDSEEEKDDEESSDDSEQEDETMEVTTRSGRMLPDDEESGDDSEEEDETMEVTTRSGRISKKRFSDAYLLNNQDDNGPRSQRNEKLKNSNTPTTSNKKKRTSEDTNGSIGKKKKIVEGITTEEEETRERAPDEDDNVFSFDISYQPDDVERVKLEPFNRPSNDDTSLRNIINNGDDFIEKISAPTENFVAPKQEEVLMEINSKVDEEPSDVSDKSSKDVEGIEKPIQPDSVASTGTLVVPKGKEMLMDVKVDRIDKKIILEQYEGSIGEKQADDVMEDLDDSMEMNSSNSQVKNGPIQQDSTTSEDVKKDDTSLILILESFHDFINILDLPILSDLQKRIESKLEECKENPKMIFNQLIYFSLELCLLKVNGNRKMEESGESFRLETFISHLRHAVVTLKLPSLMEFQEKLKGIIGELRVQNMFVPVTAIRSALQNVIDNIINS